MQLKVLDELFGWTGFRESYGNSTWRWLVAALSPKYEKRFWASSSLIGFLLYFSFRFLLSSASLSEESLCRVSSENKSISLNVILATYCCPQYSNLCLIQQRWGFRGTTSKASTSLLTGQTSTSRSGMLRRFPQGGYFGKHFLFQNVSVHHLLMHMNFKVSWPVSWFPPDTGCYREEKAGVQSFNDCFYFSGWSTCSEEHYPRSFATRCQPWTMHVSGMLQKKGVGGSWARLKRTKSVAAALHCDKRFHLCWNSSIRWFLVQVTALRTTIAQAAGQNRDWGQQDWILKFWRCREMCLHLESPKLWTTSEPGENW